MEVQPDFKELLELLNAHHVEYIIVGGYALAYHGAPRYTGDLDILVNSNPENAQAIVKALEEFGFRSLGLKPQDFQESDQVIELGYPPIRIDIMTSLSGVSLKEAFKNKVEGKYGDINVYYIGRDQLIATKSATGRKKDQADLEALGEE